MKKVSEVIEIMLDFFSCPINSKVITEFKYDEDKGHADAIMYSMFRLPDSRELHFQCDVAICKGEKFDQNAFK